MYSTDCKNCRAVHMVISNIMDNLEVWHFITHEMMHSKVKKQCSDTAMCVLAKAVAKQFLASYSFL